MKLMWPAYDGKIADAGLHIHAQMYTIIYLFRFHEIFIGEVEMCTKNNKTFHNCNRENISMDEDE